MTITLSNLNRFSKFFHHSKENYIINKTYVAFSTTPLLCFRFALEIVRIYRKLQQTNLRL